MSSTEPEPAQASFAERAGRVLLAAIPARLDPAERDAIVSEIVARVQACADLLESSSGGVHSRRLRGGRANLWHRLRDQVLIVLADYRDHAWTYGYLRAEAARVYLADLIMAGYKKP